MVLFYCKRMARCCVLRDKASLDVISRFRIVALCFLISLLGPTAAATEQAVTSGICIRRIRSAICSSALFPVRTWKGWLPKSGSGTQDPNPSELVQLCVPCPKKKSRVLQIGPNAETPFILGHLFVAFCCKSYAYSVAHIWSAKIEKLGCCFHNSTLVYIHGWMWVCSCENFSE